MRRQECPESACGQRRAEHCDTVPASPVSITTRSCPSPPNHPKNGLGSVRQSENWQKIALLCHPFVRHLPRLRYLNTSSHQKCTVWVRSAPCPCHEHGIREEGPQNAPGTPCVPAASQGTSRSSFAFTFISVCKVSSPKGTEFPRKTFLRQRGQLRDKGVT